MDGRTLVVSGVGRLEGLYFRPGKPKYDTGGRKSTPREAKPFFFSRADASASYPPTKLSRAAKGISSVPPVPFRTCPSPVLHGSSGKPRNRFRRVSVGSIFQKKRGGDTNIWVRGREIFHHCYREAGDSELRYPVVSVRITFASCVELRVVFSSAEKGA